MAPLTTAMSGMNSVLLFIVPTTTNAELVQTRNIIAATNYAASLTSIIYSGAMWAEEHASLPGLGPTISYTSTGLGKKAIQNSLPLFSQYLFPDLV